MAGILDNATTILIIMAIILIFILFVKLYWIKSFAWSIPISIIPVSNPNVISNIMDKIDQIFFILIFVFFLFYRYYHILLHQKDKMIDKNK